MAGYDEDRKNRVAQEEEEGVRKNDNNVDMYRRGFRVFAWFGS